MTRQCGDCQLCCRLLPVIDNEPWRPGEPINKPAGVRCMHQRFKKGCAVYGTPEMPYCCRAWTCRWLTSNDTADLPRPDRSHYVIDVMPDFITAQNPETGESFDVQVVQVWVDPAHRDAHRDPALRAYLKRRADEGIAALIRYSSSDAFVLIAPSMNEAGGWLEVDGTRENRDHSPEEIFNALGAL